MIGINFILNRLSRIYFENSNVAQKSINVSWLCSLHHELNDIGFENDHFYLASIMTLIFERSFVNFWWWKFSNSRSSRGRSPSLISIRQILFGFAKYSLVFAKLNFGSPTKIWFANSKFAKLFAKWPSSVYVSGWHFEAVVLVGLSRLWI